MLSMKVNAFMHLMIYLLQVDLFFGTIFIRQNNTIHIWTFELNLLQNKGKRQVHDGMQQGQTYLKACK